LDAVQYFRLLTEPLEVKLVVDKHVNLALTAKAIMKDEPPDGKRHNCGLKRTGMPYMKLLGRQENEV
jgi:hypothetical protein